MSPAGIAPDLCPEEGEAPLNFRSTGWTKWHNSPTPEAGPRGCQPLAERLVKMPKSSVATRRHLPRLRGTLRRRLVRSGSEDGRELGAPFVALPSSFQFPFREKPFSFCPPSPFSCSQGGFLEIAPFLQSHGVS